MSEIDARPMEVHLLKICEEIITLNYEDSAKNTKHLNTICTFLCAEMSENNNVFKELFQRVVPAGSYPDNLKISEPDEYDLLIVLKFPNPVVEPSRPGYVTINISEALRKGWNIDNVDYELFVDEEGYLIQNKVLNWIRSVVRKTLVEHNNVIATDEDSYEVIQSSNGPAVTLDVTVLNSENIQFSIDFVGCLAFNSDEWWTADVSHYCDGMWNAIPKPIKQVAVDNAFEEKRSGDTRKLEKIKPLHAGDERKQKSFITSQNENNKPEKVKRPPSYYYWNRNRKAKVSENVEAPTVDSTNRNIRSGNWRRQPQKPKVEDDAKVKKTVADEKVYLPNTQKSKWEKSTVNGKENTSANGFRRRPYGPWCRKKKTNEKVDETPTNIRKTNYEKPVVVEKEKTHANGGCRKKRWINRKVNNTNTQVRKNKAPVATEAQPATIIIPNPQENREWICSYAEFERQLLKGTDTMKPLIRIFKKIRDKKQLTNLKSYYIKTIFLHHNSRNGSEYWKQSLAVLFMEMFDVILTHLYEHRLDSFWHRDFNLFHGFRSGQIAAIFEQWQKMKKDLISNLENDNPEFIYDLVCTDEERLLLEQSDSESEFD